MDRHVQPCAEYRKVDSILHRLEELCVGIQNPASKA